MTTAATAKLTAAERAYAELCGMTPEEYAVYKSPHPGEDAVKALEEKRKAGGEA